MIFDELISKINGQKNTIITVNLESEIEIKKLMGYCKALRAIIHLHCPQEITLPDGSRGLNCVECDGWVYPCQTIEIIRSEIDL